MNALDAEHVGQRGDVVGAVAQAEPAGADAAAVAAVVEGHHAEVAAPSGSNDENQLRSAVAVQPCSSTTVGAPGGPASSRTKVRAAARELDAATGRDGGGSAGSASTTGVGVAYSTATISTLSDARRGLVLDDVAGPLADERLAERRARGDRPRRRRGAPRSSR